MLFLTLLTSFASALLRENRGAAYVADRSVVEEQPAQPAQQCEEEFNAEVEEIVDEIVETGDIDQADAFQDKTDENPATEEKMSMWRTKYYRLIAKGTLMVSKYDSNPVCMTEEDQDPDWPALTLTPEGLADRYIAKQKEFLEMIESFLEEREKLLEIRDYLRAPVSTSDSFMGTVQAKGVSAWKLVNGGFKRLKPSMKQMMVCPKILQKALQFMSCNPRDNHIKKGTPLYEALVNSKEHSLKAFEGRLKERTLPHFDLALGQQCFADLCTELKKFPEAEDAVRDWAQEVVAVGFKESCQFPDIIEEMIPGGSNDVLKSHVDGFLKTFEISEMLKYNKNALTELRSIAQAMQEQVCRRAQDPPVSLLELSSQSQEQVEIMMELNAEASLAFVITETIMIIIIFATMAFFVCCCGICCAGQR